MSTQKIQTPSIEEQLKVAKELLRDAIPVILIGSYICAFPKELDNDHYPLWYTSADPNEWYEKLGEHFADDLLIWITEWKLANC